MSESGWGAAAWGAGEEPRERLPQVEDLPITEHGYDRDAVSEAFDAFYRHAARLDATLRILESVEAFSRQSRELRADIRSLRAASWGPAPSARHVWSVGHEVWSPEEPPGALASSLPRLAVWSALIIAVGVGAALAELRTLVIVGLVLGAWLLVGLIELTLAGRRAARVPAPLPPEAPAAREPAQPPVVAAPDAIPEETMIAAPQPVLVPRDEDEPDEEPREQPDEQPDEEPDAVASERPEAPAREPAVVESASAPRRRFWRRQTEQRADEGGSDPAVHVAQAGWPSDEPQGDPWEADGGDGPGRPPLAPAVPPARGVLRRGRR